MSVFDELAGQEAVVAQLRNAVAGALPASGRATVPQSSGSTMPASEGATPGQPPARRGGMTHAGRLARLLLRARRARRIDDAIDRDVIALREHRDRGAFIRTHQ